MGVTRQWRSTLLGVAAALVVLAAIVAALGPSLAVLPIETLRLVIGSLLLIFGLQWLRKAILRASGFRALHDEEAAYVQGLEHARRGGPNAQGMDWYAFVLAFKSVLLEGLEVAFIVVTFGAAAGQQNFGAAGLGAALAIGLVGAAGVVLRAPLTRIPENALKFGVGVMLTTFGLFWSVEGLGIDWPGQDAAIPGIFGLVLLGAFGLVAALRQYRVALHAPVRQLGRKSP